VVIVADPLVSFEGVSKRFGSIQALDGLTFEAGEGEIFGFVGPNGCGKTTTTRLMLDLYRRDAGEIRIFGYDPAVDFARVGPQLGVTFDQHALYESLSAEEHLVFWGRMFGASGPELKERCRFLLEAVGLTTRRKSPARTFSKGMRQRLAFARSLINRPRLAIMDEPFDGIDVETKRDLVDLLHTVVREEGMTTFLTSHNLVDIERLCRRVAIVKHGQVIACDTTENLRAKTRKRQVLVVTLGEGADGDLVQAAVPEGLYDPETRCLRVEYVPDSGPPDAVVRRLMERNLPVSSFREETLSLEDIYLSLTGGGKEICG
jgi:ABC-2 type transport system ATP-binding protein